jgi:uncharacterized membrane protein YcaP (DUF421 family)
MDEMIGIVLRISILYLYVMALLRVSGKRSIHNLSAIDFVVATMVGNFFGDIVWGDVALAKGLTAISVVIFLHLVTAFSEYKSDSIHRLVASTHTTVIKNGKLVPEGMRRERTPEEEVLANVRFQQVEHLKDIKEASWEPRGELSLIKTEAAEEVQKRDIDAFRKIFQ